MLLLVVCLAVSLVMVVLYDKFVHFFNTIIGETVLFALIQSIVVHASEPHHILNIFIVVSLPYHLPPPPAWSRESPLW